MTIGAGLAWTGAFLRPTDAMMAAAFILTLALAFALATLPHPAITVERTFPRERFTEGERLDEMITLRLTRGRGVRCEIEPFARGGLTRAADGPTSVRIHRGGTAPISIGWTAAAWGPAATGPHLATVRDPLGLVERRLPIGDARAIEIHPRPASLGKFSPRGGHPEPALGAHNVSKPGDGAEFFALREYQQGDSIRRINWKASARSRSTMVNQVTRDSFSRAMVVLDLREKEGIGGDLRSPRVASGRAAASILSHHERMRDHLTLIIVQDEARAAVVAPNPRLPDLFRAMGNAQIQGDLSMEDAIRAHLTRVRPRSPIYFVTSCALDAHLPGAVRVVQALGARPLVVSPDTPDAHTVGEDAARWLRNSRRSTHGDLRRLGVPVVDWANERPLEVAFAAI